MLVSLFALHGTHAKRPPRARTPCLLRVEVLEERSLLSFSFQPLGYLGDPAPGPGHLTHTFDWEPGAINNRGQIVFGSDLSPIRGDATGADDIGEGVFLQQPNGSRVPLARVGDTPPAAPPMGRTSSGKSGKTRAATVSFPLSGSRCPTRLSAASTAACIASPAPAQ